MFGVGTALAVDLSWSPLVVGGAGLVLAWVVLWAIREHGPEDRDEPEPIGRDIGRSNSKVQAELINGLAAGMTITPAERLDMQLAYVADDLTPLARHLIVELARFCERTVDQ